MDIATSQLTAGHLTSTLQGGALGLGVSGNASLFRALHLVGLLNPMVVIAQQNTGTFFLAQGGTSPSLGQLHLNSRCSLSPALDLRLALQCAWNCSCLKTIWSVGYELNYYWHAYVFAPLDPSLPCRDLGFAGPFLRGTLLF